VTNRAPEEEGDPIGGLVKLLSRLPGVGEKSARRIAYHVLHHVVAVEPGSPADGKLKANDDIIAVKVFETPEQQAKAKPIKFEEDQRNWAAGRSAHQPRRSSCGRCSGLTKSRVASPTGSKRTRTIGSTK